MKVSIQGVSQSFHDIAARQWFGNDIETYQATTFKDVFLSLDEGEADAAVIAIENSLYGSINEVYDLLEKYRFPIIGEIHLAIHQQLIGFEGTDVSAVKKIYSHSVALAQCENWIDTHLPDAERIEYHDTAAAAEHIRELQDTTCVAIASKQAAHHLQLSVLSENIEDNPANFTRFLVIQPGAVPPSDADRSSIIITTDHTPGALAKVLTVFSERGINLAKLQSRPIIGKPWKYHFYLVLETAGSELEDILSVVRPLTTEIVVLGQYRHNL